MSIYFSSAYFPFIYSVLLICCHPPHSYHSLNITLKIREMRNYYTPYSLNITSKNGIIFVSFIEILLRFTSIQAKNSLYYLNRSHPVKAVPITFSRFYYMNWKVQRLLEKNSFLSPNWAVETVCFYFEYVPIVYFSFFSDFQYQPDYYHLYATAYENFIIITVEAYTVSPSLVPDTSMLPPSSRSALVPCASV